MNVKGHFLRRFRRVYRYFRGSPRMQGTLYRDDPRSRRRAIWLAWGYARKGGRVVEIDDGVLRGR